MMEGTGAHEAARLLLDARRRCVPLARLPEGLHPGSSIDAAYAIQDAFIELSGDTVAGYKIGATSPKAQAFLRCAAPFSGCVLACDLHRSPAQLAAGRFPFRLIEPEFAFEIAQDLAPAAEPYDEAAVSEAVAALYPAFEVVTSGLEAWYSQGVPSLVADNGVDGALILGARCADWRDLDLAAHRVALHINDEPFSQGSGANALGHPLSALTWLVNHLSERGVTLRAGQFVTTGVVTDFVELAPGDRATADFGSLGSVEIAFSP